MGSWLQWKHSSGCQRSRTSLLLGSIQRGIQFQNTASWQPSWSAAAWQQQRGSWLLRGHSSYCRHSRKCKVLGNSNHCCSQYLLADTASWRPSWSIASRRQQRGSLLLQGHSSCCRHSRKCRVLGNSIRCCSRYLRADTASWRPSW